MKVQFLKKFSKDLDEVKQTTVKQALISVIMLMEDPDSLDKIPIQKN
jgi:hypothetical protein